MSLEKLRKKIDKIDDELLKLLNKRMDIIAQIGKIKAKNKSAIYRPKREKAIIDRLKRQNKGRLNKTAIKTIFADIFAISKELEHLKK